MRARALMTLILGYLTGVGFILLAVPAAHAETAADPGVFMVDVSADVLQLLNDQQHSDAEREKQFQALVDQNFDLPRIARFVLGPPWRSASDEEKQHFNDVFRTYMVRIYWSRFRQYYGGQKFTILGQLKQSDTITLVQTQIIQPEGKPPAKVDWTVAKTAAGYKIIDVSIAGVSQSLTYRDEFSSIIQRNGGQVSALINELSKRNAG